MADPTAEDIKRLAEQQAKFNAEMNKTQDLLESIDNIISDNLTKSLEDSLKATRALNTDFSSGIDITKRLSEAQKKSTREIEELEFQRNRNLAKQASTRKGEKLDELLAEKRILDAQLKIINNNDNNLRSLQNAIEVEKQIVKEKEKATEELKKQNSLTNVIKNAAKDTFKDWTKLFSVAGIFQTIVEGALRFDKTSAEIGKNIGYGAGQAGLMAAKMQGIALSSSNINVTMKNASEAMGELNTATGFVANYSKDALVTQIMLTKQFGLTGEEAAGIYKFSVLTGKSSEKVNDEMVGAFVATRNASKVGVDFKKTMAEASKVSGQLAANLQNNPAKIVAAVVQMKALGTSLEQTKNQGASLLNFESSISKELDAELLTGKQLNLEKARAAALSGDQVTLAEELNKNVGTLADYQKMNVLQQDALADAVGLTSDQLADQLAKQKLAQESGKSLAQITKEEALEAQKRQDTQKKFNALLEKVQDLIGSIGVLFQPVLFVLGKITDNAFVFYGLLALILARTKLLGTSFTGVGSSFKGILGKITGKGGVGGAGVEAAANSTATAGGKAGAGGPKAGEGIKNTLKGISSGISSFNKVSPADIAKLAFSALALVALTPAIPALLLLQLVNGKLIQSALTGVGKGLAAFGKAVSAAAPDILIGELLLAGLGLSLMTFIPIIEAVGKVVVNVFTAIADGVSSIITSIGDVAAKLGETTPMLLLLGPALFGVAAGLGAMALSSFFAMPVIGALTALGLVAPALSALGIGGGGGNKEEGIKGAISPDSTAMIAAINEVKDAINKLYSKDSSIHMDGKKVGTTMTQSSHKVA
jgi:hypothetical protein